jgi:CheY-like chemotaxis protein
MCEGDSNRLQILLVEDNLVNQKVAQRMLKHLGYHADLANNGEEAVEAIERQPYHVVFMDIHMPEMDGLEATRIIRKLWPSEEQPRIVALTAHCLDYSRDMCIQAGMDDYISKPATMEDLQTAINDYQVHRIK